MIRTGCQEMRVVALPGGIRVHLLCGQPGKVAQGKVLCADHFPKVIE